MKGVGGYCGCIGNIVGFLVIFFIVIVGEKIVFGFKCIVIVIVSGIVFY